MKSARDSEGRGPDSGPPAAQKVPFTIDADFELGEAVAPWSRAHGADVAVRRGTVPLALPHPESRGVAWQHAAGRTLILTPSGVRFIVEGGATVRYALERGASPLDLRLFFLGTALGVLAAQRGLLPLKASAVSHDEDLHAFTSLPANGKSALAAALAARGYPFFTDSLLILDPRDLDREARCYGCDDLKLWPSALPLVDCENRGPVRQTPKYRKLYAEPRQRAVRVSGRLRTVFRLADFAKGHPPGERHFVRTERLSGSEKMKVMARDVLHSRPITVAIVGKRPLFQWIVALSRRVEVLLLIRPRVPMAFDACVDRVAALLPAAEPGSRRERPAP